MMEKRGDMVEGAMQGTFIDSHCMQQSARNGSDDVVGQQSLTLVRLDASGANNQCLDSIKSIDTFWGKLSGSHFCRSDRHT